MIVDLESGKYINPGTAISEATWLLQHESDNITSFVITLQTKSIELIFYIFSLFKAGKEKS